jgi:Zn-dependent protease with chaperone function
LRPPLVDRRALAILGGAALVVTVIVVAFYVFGVGERSRNYGGWSSGARWLIWLTPLFLLSMLPVCDWLAGRSWGKVVAYVFLAVSVLSASYPSWNPWRHPWLYNLIDALGGIPY